MEGNNLSLNAIPAPDIALRVRKSIGDLPGEYYDVVEGTGKIFWDSNYVLRVKRWWIFIWDEYSKQR